MERRRLRRARSGRRLLQLDDHDLDVLGALVDLAKLGGRIAVRVESDRLRDRLIEINSTWTRYQVVIRALPQAIIVVLVVVGAARVAAGDPVFIELSGVKARYNAPIMRTTAAGPPRAR